MDCYRDQRSFVCICICDVVCTNAVTAVDIASAVAPASQFANRSVSPHSPTIEPRVMAEIGNGHPVNLSGLLPCASCIYVCFVYLHAQRVQLCNTHAAAVATTPCSSKTATSQTSKTCMCFTQCSVMENILFTQCNSVRKRDEFLAHAQRFTKRLTLTFAPSIPGQHLAGAVANEHNDARTHARHRRCCCCDAECC